MIDVPRIFGGDFHFAGRDIHAHRIEQFRISLVQRDENVGVGIVLQIVDQLRAHLRKWRQILNVAAFQIDAEEVEIFVTLVVLRINDALISLPKVIANIAIFFRRDPLRFTAGGRTDPDVHARFPRREIRQCFSIGRKQIAAALRIFEKIADRNLRRNRAGR